MTTTTRKPKSETGGKPLAAQVNRFDWPALTEELNTVGCAQTPQLLTTEQCASISELYEQAGLFRSTIDMTSYRFGSGQYRYFASPFPETVAALREAFSLNLLPIARDWATKLGRPAPWPDSLAEWLEVCGPGHSPAEPRRCCGRVTA